MPIFRKSASDSGRLSEHYRKILQQYRFRLVKDIDPAVIFEYLPPEEGFKADIKEQILSFPTKEERNGALLDRLETRGDRAFLLFIEALNEKYKHLSFMVESSLRSLDDGEHSDHEGSATIQGGEIRRSLLRHQQRKLEPVQVVSESVDDLDVMCFDKDAGDYITCYTVPTRGRLLQEPYVKEIRQPIKEAEDTYSFMGCLIRHLVFREVTSQEIPKGVRRPPGNVKLYVIEENESLTDLKMQDGDYPKQYFSRNFSQNNIGFNNHRLPGSDPLPPKPKRHAPPIPPKSLFHQRSEDNKDTTKPADHTPKVSKESSLSPRLPHRKAEPSAPLTEAPKIPSPPKPPPLPHRLTVAKDNTDRSVSPEPDAPPVPPRITSAGPTSSLSKSLPPNQEEEKLQGEKAEEGKEGRKEEVKEKIQKTEKPLPEIVETADVDEEDSEEWLDDEILMSKEIPAPDEEEDDSSAPTIVDSGVKSSDDYDYEAVAVSEGGLLSHSKRSSSEITENDSGILNPPKESELQVDGAAKSRSSSPVSLRRFCMSESDPDSPVRRSVHTGSGRRSSKPHLIQAAAAKQWSDVPVLPNTNDSDSGDSYYEEIDALQLDSVRLHRGSSAYLHPRSTTGRTLERRHTSLSTSSHQNSTLRTVLGIYVELHKDDLLIVEKEETLNEEAIKVVPVVSENAIPSLPVSEVNSECFRLHSQRSSPRIEKSPEHETKEKQETEEDSSSPISVLKTVAALEGSARSSPYSSPSRATFLVKEKKESKGMDKETQFDEEPATAVQSYNCFRDTYLCYDDLGRGFYINKEFVTRFDDPSGEPWYYPIPVNSQQATLLLRGKRQVGCFMVYKTPESTRQKPYNLSLCNGHWDILHYHIVQNSRRDMMIEGHDHSFLSIRELVTYFKRNKSHLATRLRRPLKEAHMPISPGYHYDIQYELKRKDLNLSSTIIGKGNFGVVCCGTYHDTPVAIKILESGGEDHTQEEDAFVEEACTMAKLMKHDHIVKLIGISCSARPFYLVTEYIPNGSLRKCLNNGTIPNDHIDILFDVCLQVTSAMCHLESRRYMLHRDVAARNILVTSDNCIKLSDFGQARLVADDNYQAEKTEPIAIKWAAPEVIVHSTYSTKSDVWSLGVLYWEILSGGQLPYATMTNEQAAAFVIEGGNLEKPPGCSKDLFRVMKQCWNEEPRERPTFAMLYHTLKSKSSIYYSSETVIKTKAPVIKQSESSKQNKTPVTPSQTKKLRHKSDSNGSKLVRRSVMSEQKAMTLKGTPDTDGTKSRERLPTSSSETSLSNSMVVDNDMTRGNKIRKSLRKMMSMKPKKGKNNLNGAPEDTYTDTYA